MSIPKTILQVVIMLMLCSSGWAQSYYFKHFQVENGLSNNAVVCSIQDKLGFLWFGTKDGLNRFDGYTFKTFRTDANNPGSIGSNFIHTLYEDPREICGWVLKQVYINTILSQKAFTCLM
ncbi:ligand-binding sensor domain-containing protein [Aridibaculum aurantiacum]|uniref:ligand-binding sensor domain-containing protein n=1 Tax=Aridibaculum aurantiacum TaxID=2810307 RepID=UPI001A9563D6|nr:two-component regulator propeller domain-containing protein [Aridibaculum aurantiacum]